MNHIDPVSILLFISLIISTSLYSQKITVYGSVKDALTGENIIGAVILIKETNQVVITNNYGFYPFGKETQRIGIVPDIDINPTIQKIKKGQDELLEKAIEIINGQ